MCKQKVLVSGFNGYISRCDSCAKVQIAFGTTLFRISKNEFDLFANFLYPLRLTGDAYGLHEKRIHVDCGVQGAGMILTPYELENLIEMVESASIKNLIHECLVNRN